MQLFIIVCLPFLLLGVICDVRDLCGRRMAAAFARCHRAALRAVVFLSLLTVAGCKAVASVPRRIAGAVRGAINGWRGVL